MRRAQAIVLLLATSQTLLAQEEVPSDPQAEDLLDEVVVTASRHAEPLLAAPATIALLGREQILHTGAFRTLPESLLETPGVHVQKTAHGQGSPYIRGFTGFRNLLMVDGIRVNNSIFRDGPNQYWNTVDTLSVDRLELVRGPASVLFGSDAVGGALNAIPLRPTRSGTGFGLGGRLYGRAATAEDSSLGRVEIDMHDGADWGILGGVSWKSFGNLTGGSEVGEMPNSGYDELDGDLRLERLLSSGALLTFGFQHVGQEDVPRTHKTSDSISWRGTSVGSEVQRELDQTRDLAYGRLEWDDAGFADKASLTLSFHRQQEERDRIKRPGDTTGELKGHDVATLGLQAQFETDASTGYWTFGVDLYRDTVDSYKNKYTLATGALTSDEYIQGAIADDASYLLADVYLQNEIDMGGFELIPGVRFTHAAVEADKVEDPSGGGDPTNPADIMQLDESWDAVTSSVRAVAELGSRSTAYGGLSQGFRAPNLSDLTRLDSTSGFETPSLGLDPEHYLEAEFGLRGRSGAWEWQAATWHTFITDMIVMNPTGVDVDTTGDGNPDTPEIQKSNAGDGFLQGVELELSRHFNNDWAAFAQLGWMNGEVDQFDFSAMEEITAPTSRLTPSGGVVGVRYMPGRFWIEANTRFADNQDKLSLKDQTDTSRIPQGGTPGWATLNLRAGYRLSEATTLSFAVENIGDLDYRIHGSGQNEPGRNFVLALETTF